MPLSSFNVRKAASDGLQARCRACNRAWYVANREIHIERARLRNLATRALYLNRLGDYLQDHPCVDCGETDVRCLEFDHRDPATKVSEVTKMAQAVRAWRQIEAEIAKCDVRCANCHRRKTAIGGNTWRQRVFRDSPEDSRAAERLARVLPSPLL